MAEHDGAGEILRRALEYPYATPGRSYLFRDGGAEELPAGELDAKGRVALLAYGANAAPEPLARKLASLPEARLPVLRAELVDFDVVYSAHVSPYGAVPATLLASRGTRAPVFALFPGEEEMRLLAATELNYELRRLDGIECAVEGLGTLRRLDAFVSRHGPLRLDGTEVALSAVRSAGRTFPELDQPGVLERVRAALAPDLTLERFVLDSIAGGGRRIVSSI